MREIPVRFSEIFIRLLLIEAKNLLSYRMLQTSRILVW